MYKWLLRNKLLVLNLEFSLYLNGLKMDNNWPIKWLELLRPILNGREYLRIFWEYKPIGFKAHAMV